MKNEILTDARDEILELLSELIDEVNTDIDEACSYIEADSSEDAIEQLQELKDKLQNWMKKQTNKN
ncbi:MULTISPECIES: hypothetical protein [Campylobacter]|uniref:hypothetical protein n=1 Tax=Campylobacter TaxID=194 RepID=UPI0014707053|nr:MULTISPECIES: hypothetical protein [Campylobacter]MBN7287566.1 hypothetical protein [Campylobacter curvus]MDU6826567.1 hypothetical protein [Campylobacter sp.]